MHEEMTCQAMVDDATPCRNPAMAGSAYCWVHREHAEINIDFGDSGWLAIDDRRAGAKPTPAGGLNPSRIELAESASGLPDLQPPAGEPTPELGADILLVDDRLTQRKRREAERRGRIQQELGRFGEAAQRLAPPGTEAVLPSIDDVQHMLRQVLGPLFPRVEALWQSDYLSPDLLKGLWHVGSYLLRSQTSGAWRRLQGDYEIDDFGRDTAFIEAVLPLAQLAYRHYWRVDVCGAENLPDQGRAMLVSNHSGVLPFDGAMIGIAVHEETPSHRLPRALAASWFQTLPFASILLQKTGQVQANPLNAQTLLERDELVVVFPEGVKGIGKPYRDRYQLQRFGRGGFIKVAVRTGAPIIPVAVVGAEEIYPVIGQIEPLARLIGFPFFPITPTFPWAGPLGLVPLPTKWTIEFGQPIPVDDHGPQAAANPAVVARLTEQVRSTVQQMLLERLAKRRSVFLG
jgi:1-acyl-sn-glycerol-3-phosphate acyltransferase